MTILKDATKSRHLPRLDSLRGIGALMVIGYHAGLCGGSTPAGRVLMRAASFFFDGRNGVCIFFVLSGLVLGMSLRRAGNVSVGTYLHFCGRRFFRLYPAYCVTTFLFLVIYIVVHVYFPHGIPGGSGWFDYYLTQPVLSRARLLANFYFCDQALNPATWTLKIEAQAAFILPLIHAFSIKCRARWQVALLLLLIALSFATGDGSTRHYFYLFYLGYLIPPVLENFRTSYWVRDLAAGKWLLAVAIAALLEANLFETHGLSLRFGILFASLGSTLLLASLFAGNSFFTPLDHPFMKYLGKVSYSFYLLNMLSVDLAERAYYFFLHREPFDSVAGWWIVFPAATTIGLLASTVTYYFVERPGLKLGGILLPTVGVAPVATRA